jgi:hypothetical protein
LLVNSARLRVAALGAVCVLGASAGPSAQPVAPIAIRNARLVPVSGPPIESGTIVLANGLIRAVGARVEVPAEAVIIDGTGLTVYPGLIDAFTDLGVGGAAAPAGSTGAAAPPRRARPAARFAAPRIGRRPLRGCRRPTNFAPTIARSRRGGPVASRPW